MREAGRDEMDHKTLGKVILDTDMAYANDDTIAMFVLAQMDRHGDIDLLGITTTGGNVFVPVATTAALKQLEVIGRTDIPVYQGTDVPLAGFRNMEEESEICGVPFFCGAYWNFDENGFADMEARPTDYLDLGDRAPYGYAQRRAEDLSAWDFMIEQVHRFPGEVTIMEIGAATNVARALQEDPTIAQDAAGIYYMGGDIDVPGNATPAAELNWFYDPEAIQLCLAAPWKTQVVIPDDLARQVRWTSDFLDRLKEHDTPITNYLLSVKNSFASVEEAAFVWDPVVPIAFLNPGIVTGMQTRYLTVDTSSVLDSGRAVSWPLDAPDKDLPEGIRPVRIVMQIDEDLFWDTVVDILTRE